MIGELGESIWELYSSWDAYMMQNAIVIPSTTQTTYIFRCCHYAHTKHCKKTHRLVLPYSTRMHMCVCVCVLLLLVWNVCAVAFRGYEKIMFTARGKFFFASSVWYWKFFNVKFMYATGSRKRWHRVLDLYWLWIFSYHQVRRSVWLSHVFAIMECVQKRGLCLSRWSRNIENVFGITSAAEWQSDRERIFKMISGTFYADCVISFFIISILGTRKKKYSKIQSKTDLWNSQFFRIL